MNDSFRSKACKINWIIHSVIRSKTLIHLGTKHERFIESFTQVICSKPLIHSETSLLRVCRYDGFVEVLFGDILLDQAKTNQVTANNLTEM